MPSEAAKRIFGFALICFTLCERPSVNANILPSTSTNQIGRRAGVPSARTVSRLIVRSLRSSSGMGMAFRRISGGAFHEPDGARHAGAAEPAVAVRILGEVLLVIRLCEIKR